jgi:putative transposon-encoded protein
MVSIRNLIIMKEMRIEMIGYQVLEKTATKTGCTAHVTVPIGWLGKKVKVILLEPIDDE